jgi:hypothetical protein
MAEACESAMSMAFVMLISNDQVLMLEVSPGQFLSQRPTHVITRRLQADDPSNGPQAAMRLGVGLRMRMPNIYDLLSSR